MLRVGSNVFKALFKISPEDQQVLRFDGNVQRPEDLATSINKRTFGATSAEEAGDGTEQWQEPTVAVNPNDDATYAHLDSFGTSPSYYLNITNFNFEIPSNATIKGIIAEVRKSAGGAGDAGDNKVQLIKNGSLVTENKANADDWPTSFASVAYGGSTDLWGTTWTATEVNSSSTGLMIQVKNEGTNEQLNVSGVWLTIYYTIPV